VEVSKYRIEAMTEEIQKPTRLKRFLDHDGIRVLGFIADMIAIVTVLWGAMNPNTGEAFSFFTSRWFMLAIWLIALYTYICILHGFWTRTIEKDKWSTRFSVFFIGDLIIRFRRPIYLFPILILLITFFAITGASGFILLGPLSFLIFMRLLIGWESFEKKYVHDGQKLKSQRSSGSDSKKILVNEKWEELVPIIDRKLSNVQWIDWFDFNDLHNAWELPWSKYDNEMPAYVFSKYALQYPDKAFFGAVFENITNEDVAFDVLINLALIDTERYYFG
jgi:hypothetical protein